MLSQLLQFVSMHSDRLSSPRPRHRRTLRGRFEQLETRAMLTASIGGAPAVVSLSGESHDEVAGPVGPPAVFVYPTLAASSLNADADDIGHGPGRPQSIKMSDPGRPRFVANEQPPPPMGISYGASTIPGEVYVDAWKLYGGAESAPTLVEFRGSVPFGELDGTLSIIENTFDPGKNYEWHGQPSNVNYVAQNHGGNDSSYPEPKPPVIATGGNENVVTPNGSRYDPIPGRVPPLRIHDIYPLELATMNSESAGQTNSAASLSALAYDSVFQSYSTQSNLLTLDSSSTGTGAVSLADSRWGFDDGQGGFVGIDDANSLDGSASYSTADAKQNALDVVLANLDILGSSAIAHDMASRDPADMPGANEMLIADGQQGGMVMLESVTGPSSDTALAAGQATAPTNWNVPETGVSMEASVGIYQAFDVATGDLTSSAPAAIATPAVKHNVELKNHVSADQKAKPTNDQASVWMEMMTAAAVIGTAKKKRKSQSR